MRLLISAGRPFCLAVHACRWRWAEYRLGISYRIKVTVFGETELSDDLLIDGAGNIEVLSPIPTKDGKSRAEARSLVIQRLKTGFKEPIVTVHIRELRPIYCISSEPNPPSAENALTAVRPIQNGCWSRRRNVPKHTGCSGLLEGGSLFRVLRSLKCTITTRTRQRPRAILGIFCRAH